MFTIPLVLAAVTLTALAIVHWADKAIERLTAPTEDE